MGCRLSSTLKRLEALANGMADSRGHVAPAPTSGPEPPVWPSTVRRELQPLLEASTSLGPEQRDAWEKWMKIQTKEEVDAISPWQLLCQQSTLRLAESAGEMLEQSLAEVTALKPLPVQLAQDMPCISHLCCLLETLDLVLCCCGSIGASQLSEEVLPKLEDVWEVLHRYARATLLKPTLPDSSSSVLRTARLLAGDLSAAAPRALQAPLVAETLRIPLQMLVRCTPNGPEVSASDLLELVNQDFALAIFTAVSGMRSPRASSRLTLKLWQVLQELSSFQFFSSEMSSYLTQTAETPLQDIVAEYPSYAHGLAFCLIQADALEACCDLAGMAEAPVRAGIIMSCLRMLHCLSASNHLWSSGRLLARRIAILWPRFGYRILAPHLRRLATQSEAGNLLAQQSSRELRRDLRTLGWLLHHAPELASLAQPLATELTLKLLRVPNMPPETLAVAIGMAANAGALDSEGTLVTALAAMEVTQKEAVQEKFPEETNRRLWIIEAAWPIIEELGLWPSPEEVSTDEETTKRQKDTAAIAHLTPAAVDGFSSVLPGGVDDADLTWAQDWEPEVEVDKTGADVAEPEIVENPGSSIGPLGELNVPPPGPKTLGRKSLFFSQLTMCPKDLRCALDGRLCTEPVFAAPGGELLDVLYQRSSILSWLSHRQVCPITGVPLKAEDLLPAVDRCAALLNWAARQY
eukprot:symbB.v1.2.023604.t1/scaffold2171.1/size87081/2